MLSNFRFQIWCRFFLLIIKWDNAPHHKELITFPHHKHSPTVKESYSINLEDVINEIAKNLDEAKD
ncbi:MAG: toxin-antitoxin system TumE family protein [Promethearchaeota archaeon]